MLSNAFFSQAGLTLLFSLLAAFFYYKKFYKKDIATSVVLYSLLIFNIVFFISFENNIGLGIGLLGILSLIRLRSTLDNLTDIGFIFYAIGIGLLNASISSIPTLLVVDGLLAFILILLSSDLILFKEKLKTEIVFDELIVKKANDLESVKKEIQKQYGIYPIHVNVKNINHLKDSTTIEVIYDSK